MSAISFINDSGSPAPAMPLVSLPSVEGLDDDDGPTVNTPSVRRPQAYVHRSSMSLIIKVPN